MKKKTTLKMPPTTSAEMRDVTLSVETKEFLVAHRMIEEVGNHVSEQMKKFYGESKKNHVENEMESLWASIREGKEEIINLMADVISERLGDLEVTEI